MGKEETHRLGSNLAAPLLVTAAAAGAGLLRGIPAAELLRGLPAIFLLLSGYFVLGSRQVVDSLSRRFSHSPRQAFGLVQAGVVPYLLYALPLGCFSLAGFARLLLWVNLPLLALLTGRKRGFPAWGEFTALLLVWLPLEFKLLGPLWPWPPGQKGYFLFGLMGVSLAVYLFVILDRLDDVGYTFALRGWDVKVAVAGFLLFAAFAIPTGLATGFLHVNRHAPSLLPSVGRVLGIFLVTGIPEELLFRGLLQNLMERWTGRPTLALLGASLLFGAAHLNNVAHADWRYFLLAGLAGVVYGLAYRIGGTLLAPALTHTLVDSTWAVFFRG